MPASPPVCLVVPSLPVGLVLLALSLRPVTARAQHEEDVATAALPYAARQVYAVQPRSVPKRHALELAATVGVTRTDALRVYVPVGVRAAFHLSEVWAVEASGAYLLAAQTSLVTALGRAGVNPRTWQTEQAQLRVDAAVRAAPLYGKLLAGRRILHLELYALVGGGIVRTLAAPSLGVGAAIRPAALLAGGLGLLLGNRWTLRLEYRQALVARPASGLAWPAEVGLSGGVLLGARR